MWRCFPLSGPLALLTVITAATAGFGQDESPFSPIGFAPGSRATQATAEAFALKVPTPENCRALLRTLTEEPHVAGTPADHKTALFVRDKLREWGWQAELAEYEVLLNYPRVDPVLELIRGDRKELSLSLIETPNATDKDTASPDVFPAFHGYGVSDSVRGQVVYVNYGRPEDYVALDRLGVDVKDKIVLARYGEIFRGLKVRNAQKRKAKGILIYSDPVDDGFAKGDVYPNGPYRPGSALQRGSVQFLSLGPGDPSTPNGPSIKGAKRLPIDPHNGFTTSAETIEAEEFGSRGKHDKVLSVADWEKTTGLVRDDYYASIPSLPISYDAAKPILQALGGPNVPPGWQGGLPLAYHVGPGPAEVFFAIHMDYQIRTIWNVIATIKGVVEPDRQVIIGNHRDAWVYGAVDPSSGTAATLETCRAIGAAVKNGWSPRRTLVYASWDAEEYGLVGSTEWADEHSKELSEKAVLLLNVDSAVGGHDLDVDGVPSLRDAILDAAAAVTDPRSGRNLRAIWSEKRRAAWAANSPLDLVDPLWESSPGKFSPQLNALGSGSDYTAFVDHLGIPAVDVGFAGRYGVYHSVFDNFYWMEKFCDPEFLTHATAARLYTVFAMRAAGSEVVPLRFTAYGEALRDYVDDLRRHVERRQRATPPGQPRPGPMSFIEGLLLRPGQVGPGVSGPGDDDRSGHRVDRRARRDRAGPAGKDQRRPDAGRAGLLAARRSPRPSLVQARGLRPRAHHRLRLLALARGSSGRDRKRRRHARRAGSRRIRPHRCGHRGAPPRGRGRQGRPDPHRPDRRHGNPGQSRTVMLLMADDPGLMNKKPRGHSTNGR